LSVAGGNRDTIEVSESNSNENSLNALANTGRNLPRNCAGLFAQFRATNIFVALPTHQYHFVTNIDILDMGDVDHH
jgi:hypothetical protein